MLNPTIFILQLNLKAKKFLNGTTFANPRPAKPSTKVVLITAYIVDRLMMPISGLAVLKKCVSIFDYQDAFSIPSIGETRAIPIHWSVFFPKGYNVSS